MCYYPTPADKTYIKVGTFYDISAVDHLRQ